MKLNPGDKPPVIALNQTITWQGKLCKIRGERMTEPTVKCLICGQECMGETALTHWKETGHNSWELLTPYKGGGEEGV